MTMKIEPSDFAQKPSASFAKRFTRSQLWAFIVSLKVGTGPRLLADELVFGHSVDATRVSTSLKIPHSETISLMQELLGQLFQWQRGGRGDRPWLVEPPYEMLLYSTDEFKAALIANLDDSDVERIDREAIPTFASDDDEDHPKLASVIRPRPRLIVKLRQLAESSFRLAAAGNATKDKTASDPTRSCPSSFDKFPWDCSYGDWSLTFFTDRKQIHVAGLPENGVTGLEVRNESYSLVWVPELKMHKIPGLTRRELQHAIDSPEDESAFKVLPESE
ncbi:MAG: hypothetical protein JWQ90_3413 [Hydrocarboniphaga sp.]|uniref:hypothetical protein n=1 Tax=Hydrocarboniphaga sp. TaxID=2033016 RepID=UPI002615205F|nr:hypothetical protein [Hydrocarboniphaga sp.]MDB5970963.1 hypothetical protein [Hydrocarboniphaga sp.]